MLCRQQLWRGRLSLAVTDYFRVITGIKSENLQTLNNISITTYELYSAKGRKTAGIFFIFYCDVTNPIKVIMGKCQHQWVHQHNLKNRKPFTLSFLLLLPLLKGKTLENGNYNWINNTLLFCICSLHQLTCPGAYLSPAWFRGLATDCSHRYTGVAPR